MTMRLSVLSAEPVTMSSREIAELCEKQHAHVMRDIRDMLVQLHGEEGLSKFGSSYLNAQNKEQPEFLLPKRETLILVSGYRLDLRARIIDRWQELESQKADPAKLLNDPDVLRHLLLEHATKRIEAEKRAVAAEAKAETMREDVEAFDRIARADGSLSITEAAKNLGIRPKDLFEWLAHNGWIYKRPHGSSWLGYQSKCNQGLLEHKTTTVLRVDGSEKIAEQVRVTAKGLSALAKLVQPIMRLIA